MIIMCVQNSIKTKDTNFKISFFLKTITSDNDHNCICMISSNIPSVESKLFAES